MKLKFFVGCFLLSIILSACNQGIDEKEPETKRPNVLLVMTDDQGYSDVGYNGNPHLNTPNIDEFASKSVIFDRFYAYPLCSPSRAALMTGRYPFRSAVTRTAQGRSILRSDEITVAEVLQEEGYKTGLFGKWHLGDHMPSRPQDQGFDDVLMHVGGMIGAPYSPRNGESYFDPVLLENGVVKTFEGYTPDIFTDAAITFINETEEPFFTFLSLNTPHHPLTVSDEYLEPYLEIGLSRETARYYGMITNIDDNFERVINAITKKGELDNTLVIFLGDNGTSSLHKQEDLWSAGMKGRKTYVYENGIRVPMFVRFPNTTEPNKIEHLAAVIDVMPTILEVTGIQHTNLNMDGFSLNKVIQQHEEVQNRQLFTQSHGGEEAVVPFRNISVHSGDFKLVQSKGRGITPFDPETINFELYNIREDQNETNDLAQENVELVESLKSDYLAWLNDVSTRGYDPVPIWIGESENPVELTRQDWFKAGLFDGSNGVYHLEAKSSGVYQIKGTWSELLTENHKAFLRVNDRVFEKEILYAESSCIFEEVRIDDGNIEVGAWIEIDGKKNGFRFLEISKLEI